MKFFFVRNHSTSTAEKLEGNPWDYENTRPHFPNKAAFRKWCKNDETEHCFFSGYEGVNPNNRVEGENNPALKQWAWIADYDYKGEDWDEFNKRLKKDLPEDLQPTAASETFSGGRRIVWVFESFIWSDQKEVHDAFLKRLAGLLKAERLAPGFDVASFSVTTTWELGDNWHFYGNTLSKQTLTKLQFEACKAVKSIRTEYTELPWDKIQGRAEELYPGRLTGFTLGRDVRVPLFWIDDGIPDQSAICAEWGVYSFSTRAEQGMTFWPEILGDEFMRQFEEKKLSAAIENTFYDGKSYWVKNVRGMWSARNRDEITQDLKVQGYSHRLKKKRTATEIDEIMATIRDQHQVVAAAPFTHSREQFIDHNGDRYLNINHKTPLPPAAKEECVPENFPWLAAFLDGFFDEILQNGERPLDYWLADLQRTLQHLQRGEPVSGKAEVLAGDKNLGKSLMAVKIKRMIYGSNTDAGKFLLEQGSFNKELAESFHWYVDDNQSASSSQRHMLFTETLKKHVATPEVRYRPMYKDARVIPWYGRITITCNDDPDSLSIIPNMDMTMKDKVSLYKLQPREFQFPPNIELEKILVQELPYFVGWLQWHYDAPKKCVANDARYGIKPYHHPELLKTSKEVTGHARLEEMLRLWREIQNYDPNDPDDSPEWTGTSSALLAEMNVHEGLRAILKTYTPIIFTRGLNKLLKDGGAGDWLSFDSDAGIWTLKLMTK